MSFPLAYDWSEVGIWPFSFAFCWVWTFSSFQTYLLLKDDTHGRLKWLTACVTNAIFLTWLVLVSACLCSMVWLSCRANHRAWNLRDAVLGYCERHAATFDPAADNAAMTATAQALLDEYNTNHRSYLDLMGRLWGAYIATQAGTLIVKLALNPPLRPLRPRASPLRLALRRVLTASPW